MKLLSCHIDDFGALHDLTYDFNPENTVIFEENGWGKSTFAAFLRAMFFGLFKNGLSIEKNERLRYKPWQGGAFGGTVTFEIHEKQYALTRHFGEKESADTFDLRDARTNLPSADYTEKIGEEIFGIDRESFVRTVFMGQDDLTVSVTSGINAKIGNFETDTGDMNRFSEAMEILKNRQNHLSPKTKTGLLWKLQNEITGLETAIRMKAGIPGSIDAAEEFEQKENEKLAEFKGSLQSLRDAEKEALDREQRAADAARYRELKERLYEKENLFRAEEMNFPNGAPEKGAIADLQEEARAELLASAEAEKNTLTEEEEGDFESLSKHFDAEALKDGRFRIKLRRLQETYGGRDVLVENRERAERKEADSEAAADGERKRKLTAELLLVPGLVLLAAGAAVAIFLPDYRIPAIAGAALGLVISVLSVVFAGKRGRSAKALETEAFNAGNASDAYGDEIAALDAELTEEFAAYGRNYSAENFFDDIALIQEDGEAFRRLSEKKAAYERASQEFATRHGRVEAFLQRFDCARTGDSTRDLALLSEKRTDYAHAKTAFEEAQAAFESFKGTHDAEKLEYYVPFDGGMTVSEIRAREEAADTEIEACRQRIRGYEKQLEELREELEAAEEDAERLEALREEKARREKEYRTVLAAARNLSLSHENLTVRYSKPILDAFTRIYRMIEPRDAEDYRIDANTHLTVMAYGEQREIVSYSKGCRDLVGLCLRFALIEAMYPAEKPFIILDDPFTNLDTARLSEARALLDKLSAEYQTIYFTCHESRK